MTSSLDGLNPHDPGIGLLAEAVRGHDPRSIVLVCTGPVPGTEGALRFILDVRERSDAHGPTRPWTATDDTDPIEGPPPRSDTPHEAKTKHEPRKGPKVPEDDSPRRGSRDGSAGAGEGLRSPSIEIGKDTPSRGVALVWPRAHLGKDFAEQCLARAGLTIAEGGTVLCAVRKQKGADSLAELMARLFGNVRTEARARGYRLLASDRNAGFDHEQARASLAVRYRIDDPALGDVSLTSAPGVFSRRHLDDGTRCLLDHARSRIATPRTIVDLCTGVGPLAIWAARQVSDAHVLAVDSNVLAASLAHHNAAANGVGERVHVLAHDGLPPHASLPCELALVNPPTHADLETLAALLLPLRTALHRGAPAWIVANRPERIAGLLAHAGARIQLHGGSGQEAPTGHERYTIIDARW